MEQKQSEDLQELARSMTFLSQKYTGEPWSREIEYWLYLQLSGWKFKNVFCLEPPEITTLRKLSQDLGGWLLRDDNEQEPRFISTYDWNEKYCEWHFRKQFETVGYLEK